VTAEPILRVRDLSVTYGKVAALANANLQVGGGQIVTVIGPNGAGKTTMLAAIMGALPANGGARGDVLFDGIACVGAPIEQLVARGMTLVPEKRELFGEMSVEDNLLLGAFQRYRHGHRDQAETMAEVYTLFPRLKERHAQLAGTLSGGERQMLAIGRALMAQPKILLLDEPLMGLSPLMQAMLMQATLEIRDERKISIIITEQYARPVIPIVNYAFILENGSAVLEGAQEELMNNPDVRSAYFGI